MKKATTDKTDIRKLSEKELIEEFTTKGEQKFRAKQVMEWLWNKSSLEFEEMSNLSLSTREWLSENYTINPVRLNDLQKSSDGTLKAAFQLHDGHFVEGVLIPTKTRMTACISSQVGCSLSCKFCATGYMKIRRNLDPAEIYDQVVHIRNLANEHYDKPLTNIVFMGMGEPLLNYKNVLQAIEYITSEKGLGMSSKRITLSTAGIAKMIRKLADDGLKTKLALSLHAANDTKRNEIMSINETNNLEVLKDSLQYFSQATNSRITLEYIVFNDFNDSLEDARELYQFSKSFPSKVNIIEYNPISEADFVNTTQDKLDVFADYLEKKGVIVKVRRSRGKDIDAACGQLANKK